MLYMCFCAVYALMPYLVDIYLLSPVTKTVIQEFFFVGSLEAIIVCGFKYWEDYKRRRSEQKILDDPDRFPIGHALLTKIGGRRQAQGAGWKPRGEGG